MERVNLEQLLINFSITQSIMLLLEIEHYAIFMNILHFFMIVKFMSRRVFLLVLERITPFLLYRLVKIFQNIVKLWLKIPLGVMRLPYKQLLQSFEFESFFLLHTLLILKLSLSPILLTVKLPSEKFGLVSLRKCIMSLSFLILILLPFVRHLLPILLNLNKISQLKMLLLFLTTPLIRRQWQMKKMIMNDETSKSLHLPRIKKKQQLKVTIVNNYCSIQIFKLLLTVRKIIFAPVVIHL
mmetsp:Transcript_18401/g.23942  ORF Transcript_18401/g.23942 Transcript_18401/m.23942 type:complete len:240 (-) Transcript_18401:2590-3309(-)